MLILLRVCAFCFLVGVFRNCIADAYFCVLALLKLADYEVVLSFELLLVVREDRLVRLWNFKLKGIFFGSHKSVSEHLFCAFVLSGHLRQDSFGECPEVDGLRVCAAFKTDGFDERVDVFVDSFHSSVLEEPCACGYR